MTLSTPTLETDIYGTSRWCVDGELHRMDGPALEHPDGHKEW